MRSQENKWMTAFHLHVRHDSTVHPGKKQNSNDCAPTFTCSILGPGMHSHRQPQQKGNYAVFCHWIDTFDRREQEGKLRPLSYHDICVGSLFLHFFLDKENRDNLAFFTPWYNCMVLDFNQPTWSIPGAGPVTRHHVLVTYATPPPRSYPTPSPGNHYSAFCLCRSASSGYVRWLESYTLWSFGTGFFHLASCFQGSPTLHEVT